MYPSKDCKLCTLCSSRTKVVFARGNPTAKLVIVGEAPGFDEDLVGLPFVGKSGKLLDSLLNQADVTDYYITNVCKCRPFNNRTPMPNEIQTCGQFLSAELSTIKPTIIVALGKTASEYLVGQSLFITKVRGKVWLTNYGKVLTSFHPSFLLRNHGKYDADVINDFKLAKSLIDSNNT